jgi:hypothetical protein
MLKTVISSRGALIAAMMTAVVRKLLMMGCTSNN